MSLKIRNHPGLVILFCLGLLVVVFLFPELQRRPLHSLARPFVFLLTGAQAGFTYIGQGLGNLWTDYIDLTSVRQENKRLKKDLAQAQQTNILLQETAQTRAQREQLLRFKNQNTYSLLMASVIGRDISNWYRTVKIDKGARDGVAVEMGVIVPMGVVGRVIETSRTTSRVLLLTDRNSAVAGRVQRTRDEALVQGTERGLARLQYLSLLAKAKEGDLVLTSGLAGVFPKGLWIGSIGTVMKEEHSLFQQAELRPRVDFSRLEEVLVITSLNHTEEKK